MSRSGFTFIELILVMTLMISLTILSTGWYSRFLTQNAVANTADQIAGSLRKARTFATSGKGNANWGVAYATNTLTLYRGTSFAARVGVLDEIISINTNVTVTGLSDINFTRATGIPSGVATIIVSGNNTSKTISVNSQGGISQ